jgi:hypothetical protein
MAEVSSKLDALAYFFAPLLLEGHIQRSLLMGDVFATMLDYRKFFPNCAWRAS